MVIILLWHIAMSCRCSVLFVNIDSVMLIINQDNISVPDPISRCHLKSIEIPFRTIAQSSYLHNEISYTGKMIFITLQWRHNGRECVWNHQPRDCLLSRLFRRRSKKLSKLRVTGLCVVNSPLTSEFPAQRASNAENVFIWWRHHDWVARCRGKRMMWISIYRQ